MDPIQALNVLSQVVKGAKLPFNDHVLLERCVDVITQRIQSKTSSDGSVTQSEVPNVTFDEPEPVEDVIVETPKPRARARARAKKK